MEIILPATVNLAKARAAFTAQVRPGRVKAFREAATTGRRRMAATGKTYTGVVRAIPSRSNHNYAQFMNTAVSRFNAH